MEDHRVLELEVAVESAKKEVAQAKAQEVTVKTQLALKNAECEELAKEIRDFKLKGHSQALESQALTENNEAKANQVSDLLRTIHDLNDEKSSLQKFLEDRLMTIGTKENELS